MSMAKMTVAEFLETLASSSPTPTPMRSTA